MNILSRISYAFLHFRGCLSQVFCDFSMPGSLVVLHLLQSSLRFLLPVYLWLCYLSLDSTMLEDNRFYLLIFCSMVILILPFVIRQKLSIALLHGYDRWLKTGTVPSVMALYKDSSSSREIFFKSSRYAVGKNLRLAELMATTAFFRSGEFMGLELWQEEGFEEILRREKNERTFFDNLCRFFFIASFLILFFPKSAQGFQSSIVYVFFFTLTGSLFGSFHELFRFLNFKRARYRFAYACSLGSSDFAENILEELRARARMQKIGVGVRVMERWEIWLYLFFYALIFSLSLSWLTDFFLKFFVLFSYLILPSTHEAIRDSRLFLSFRIAGENVSYFSARLIVNILSFLSLLAFFPAFLFMILYVPHAEFLLSFFSIELSQLIFTAGVFLSFLLLAVFRFQTFSRVDILKSMGLGVLFIFSLGYLAFQNWFLSIGPGLPGLLFLVLILLRVMKRGV